ncbi:MAG: hypothetical protein LBK58_12365 [Prevotellaceae bacterium]|jgi:hypothetical protein|nr:hypothetical protein [Prevotellaceae bacterium]
MKIENVDFDVRAVAGMTEKQFIETHLSTVRTDLPVETREKWLAMAYGKISGRRKNAEKTSEKATELD